MEGRGDFILKEKLRLLKERLRWWNKTVFSKLDLEVEEKVRAINFGDDCLEEEVVENHYDIMKNRKEASSIFWLNLRIKENMLVQKSKVKWLNERDYCDTVGELTYRFCV